MTEPLKELTEDRYFDIKIEILDYILDNMDVEGTVKPLDVMKWIETKYKDSEQAYAYYILGGIVLHLNTLLTTRLLDRGLKTTKLGQASEEQRAKFINRSLKETREIYQ